MKRVYFILSLACLLFVSSCGIPNMLVPEDNSVSIYRYSDGKAKITINDSYLLSDECNESYSPEVNLFYVVKGQNYSSQYSSLLSKFNSDYCASPYCNPISVSNEDGKPLVTYSYSDMDFGLYQFYRRSSVVENSFLIDGSFNFEFEYEDGVGLYIHLLDNYGNEQNGWELFRSNGESFTKASYLRGNELIDEGTSPIEVYVYASVTFSFREYTNIWNRKLSSSEYLYSFIIE